MRPENSPHHALLTIRERISSRRTPGHKAHQSDSLVQTIIVGDAFSGEDRIPERHPKARQQVPDIAYLPETIDTSRLSKSKLGNESLWI